MAVSSIRINEMILHQLAAGERQILSLTVAVRNSLQRSDVFKGDLPATVESALRKLIAAKLVVNTDGMYSLALPKERPSHIRKGMLNL